MHNEKISKEQPSAENESLTIDSPDSVHEKEADDIAMKVVHGDQLMGGGDGIPKGQIRGSGSKNDGMISRKGAKMGEQGMVASNNVREGINATKGGGDLLSGNVKQQMKGVLGGELDDVRIHTDSKADQMSKAVNANAFTIGKDIYFRQGKFDTHTSEGKQLLAHELAHTGQNSGAEMIQRTPVSSYWGTWDTSKFNVWPDEQNPYGIDISLSFTPGDKVTDAKKIGFVQSIKLEDNGYAQFPRDQDYWARSIQDKDKPVESTVLGTNEKGFAIDRSSNFADPLIQADKSGVNAKLGKTKEQPKLINGKPNSGFSGLYGRKFTDPSGAIKMDPVTLEDTPYNSTEGNGSKGTLETTALVVEGAQSGTYLGSVKWGWEKNESGNFIPHPPEIASFGAATSTFFKAGKLWNANDNGVKSIQFNADARVVGKYGADFYTEPDDNSTLKKLAPGTMVVVFNSKDENDKPDLNKDISLQGKGVIKRRVQISDGPFAGMIGWMELYNLSTV